MLGVRGHTLRGTVKANPTHHAEGPWVEGHMPRGKDAANPTHLPTGDATPQVMVVSPLASYCTSRRGSTRILVNTGSALILV